MKARYNKTCSLEDFADPDLMTEIREIYRHEATLHGADYPAGVADSRQWQHAMCSLALRDHGALSRGARILNLGAGTDPLSFYLTRHAGEVVAADLYGRSAGWADSAPASFLTDPAQFARSEYEAQRLVPLCADGRSLNLPDDTFDAVCSVAMLEYAGTAEYAANCAYEIGRVLRPGGVAAISTTIQLAGPPLSDGFHPEVLLFPEEKLRQFLIEASGLIPVDEPCFEPSEETLAVRRDLHPFLSDIGRSGTSVDLFGVYPNLVLYYEGHLFCSVHLTLRKSEDWPASDNGWAEPTKATRELVRSQASASAVAGTGSTLLQALRRQDDRVAEDRAWLRDRVEVLTKEWQWLDSELKSAQDKISAQEGELQVAREVIPLLHEQKNAHLADLEACRSALASSEETVGVLRERIASVERELGGSQESVAALQEAVFEVQEQLKRSEQEVRASRQRIAVLEKDLAESRALAHKLQNDAWQWNRAHDTMRDAFRTSAAAHASVSAAYEAAMGSLSWRITAPVRWLLQLFKGG